MKREYDYDVKVRKLIPPIGEFQYFAKVSFVVEYAPPDSPRELTPPAGEYYGADESTAHAKAVAAMETWINDRKNP